jgi:cytochrome P450
MHLAEMEMSVLLSSILSRIKEIHVGEPTMVLNNTLYSFATLPTRFVAR